LTQQRRSCCTATFVEGAQHLYQRLEALQRQDRLPMGINTSTRVLGDSLSSSPTSALHHGIPWPMMLARAAEIITGRKADVEQARSPNLYHR
jgi:hypothetical protein